LKTRLRILLAVSALLLAGVPALAGPPIAPPSLRDVLAPNGGPVLPGDFQGIWNYTLTAKDCEFMFQLFSQSGTDTICADDSAALPDTSEGGNFSCEGDVTSNGYHVVCSGSVATDDTCTVMYSYDITATLSGNTLTYVGLFNTTFDHCGDLPPSCIRYEYTATRVGNANTECATPVETLTWGRLKSRYR